MRFDTLLRSFLIASLISFLALLLETAYYGLHPGDSSGTTYALTGAFVNNYSDLSGPVNIILIALIFLLTFMIALNKISKKERH